MRRQSLLEETVQLKAALNRAQQDLSAARTKDVMRIEKLAQSNTHLQSQLKASRNCRLKTAL